MRGMKFSRGDIVFNTVSGSLAAVAGKHNGNGNVKVTLIDSHKLTTWSPKHTLPISFITGQELHFNLFPCLCVHDERGNWFQGSHAIQAQGDVRWAFINYFGSIPFNYLTGK